MEQFDVVLQANELELSLDRIPVREAAHEAAANGKQIKDSVEEKHTAKSHCQKQAGLVLP